MVHVLPSWFTSVGSHLSEQALLIMMLMPMIIIVIPMPSSAIMISPVVIVVVLAVPMSFVHHPAFAVVVVMRMRPVCPFKWWTLPMPPHPSVPVTHRLPIAFNPHEPCTGRRSRLFINHRRRRCPDVHRDLRRTRRNHSCGEQCTIHPMQFHRDLLFGRSDVKSSTTSGPFAGSIRSIDPSPCGLDTLIRHLFTW